MTDLDIVRFQVEVEDVAVLDAAELDQREAVALRVEVPVLVAVRRAVVATAEELDGRPEADLRLGLDLHRQEPLGVAVVEPLAVR